MKKILFLLILLCTNCFATNAWQCADQIKPTSSWDECELFKVQIPGGWIVRSGYSYGIKITFVPDPDHRWK